MIGHQYYAYRKQEVKYAETLRSTHLAKEIKCTYYSIAECSKICKLFVTP